MIQGPGPRSLEVEKVRGLPPPAPVTLYMGPDGLFRLDGQPTAEAASAAQRKRLAELVKALAPGPLKWADLLKASGQTGGTFDRYLRIAVEQGLIRLEDGFYSLSPAEPPPSLPPPPAPF